MVVQRGLPSPIVGGDADLLTVDASDAEQHGDEDDAITLHNRKLLSAYEIFLAVLDIDALGW